MPTSTPNEDLNEQRSTGRQRSGALDCRNAGHLRRQPRIYGTRLPIWGLEAARRAGRSDQSILEAYPALTPAALELAWGYIESHREAIEEEIRENYGTL